MRTTVQLSQLAVDKINVRKTGRGSEPMYVGSIRAKGIIEPLTVRSNGKGYTITNGGQRFASLQWMLEHKDVAAGVAVTADYPVPVNVRDEDDKDALSTSLMTNIIRAGMHPVDEYEAFVALQASGMTEATIANDYSFKEKEVRQRLALGRLSPKIRDAWRAGDITEEVAMAFTLAPNVKEQERVFAKLKSDRWGIHEHKVRSAFVAKQQDVGRFVAFVGLDALRAARVKINEDLFGSNHTTADPKAVKKLADEKLATIVAGLVADGWKWAATKDELPREAEWSWGRVEAKASKATPEEAKRLEELNTLRQRDVLDDEADEAAMDEVERVNAAIALRSYSADQKARSGCIVEIGREGELQIKYGVLKPGEKRKEEVNKKVTAKKRAGTSTDDGTLSNAIVQRMSEQLTAAAETTLAAQPNLALAALIAGFSAYEGPVDVTCRGIGKSKGEDSDLDVSFAEALAAAMKRTPAENVAHLARIVAAALDMQVLHATSAPLRNEDFAALCDALPPVALNQALRKTFDYADYFGAVSKPLVLKAISEAGFPDEARKLAGKKKAEVTASALANVPGAKWLPPELRTAHYDGPGATAAKKAAKPKKAR